MGEYLFPESEILELTPINLRNLSCNAGAK